MKLFTVTWMSLLLLFGLQAHAKTTDPEHVAREYFQAMQSEGLSSMGRFMHPEALAEFKSMLMPIYLAEAAAGERQLMDLTFGKTGNVTTLEQLAPADFMTGFMNLIVVQTGSETLSFERLEVLGTIVEGDAHHVLTRMTVGSGDISVTQFEVLSFIPFQGEWRLQLNGEMKGIAEALRATIR